MLCYFAVAEEAAAESYSDYADYTDPSDTTIPTTPIPTTPIPTTPAPTKQTTVFTAIPLVTITAAPTMISSPSSNGSSVINYLKPQRPNVTGRMPAFQQNSQIPQLTSPSQRLPQNNFPQPNLPSKNQPQQKVANSFRTGGLKEISGQKVLPRSPQGTWRQQEKVKKIADRRLKNLKKKMQKQSQQKGQSKSKVQSSSKKIMNHF